MKKLLLSLGFISTALFAQDTDRLLNPEKLPMLCGPDTVVVDMLRSEGYVPVFVGENNSDSPTQTILLVNKQGEFAVVVWIQSTSGACFISDGNIIKYKIPGSI